MNAPTDTADRVRKLIAEHLCVEESKCIDGASLRNDLAADSLDTIELVMAFEQEFGIEIRDEDYKADMTVADAIHVVEKALA